MCFLRESVSVREIVSVTMSSGRTMLSMQMGC